MKAPVTAAQAMSHPDVAMTINTLGKMADELREKVDRQDKLLREALEYATFCWRDVPMNDYAVERTDTLIAAIEKELKV